MITLHRLKDWLDEQIEEEKKSVKGSRLHILRAELRAITRVIKYLWETGLRIRPPSFGEISSGGGRNLRLLIAYFRRLAHNLGIFNHG
jgi:hypothetical protein